jgi:hypothetical protein
MIRLKNHFSGWLIAPLTSTVEAVGKVPKQIFGRDAEKSDLIECATINDLMLGRARRPPKTILLIVLRGFFYRLVRRIGGLSKK